MLQGETNIDLIGGDPNWFERFKVYLSGTESVLAELNRMEFSDAESKTYFDEVKNGSIVLFMDKEYGNQVDKMDSSAESDRSGVEMNDNEQSLESDGVSPRLNTRNL